MAAFTTYSAEELHAWTNEWRVMWWDMPPISAEDEARQWQGREPNAEEERFSFDTDYTIGVDLWRMFGGAA